MADPLVTWVAEIDAGDGLAELREQMEAVQADFREAEEAAKQAAAAIDTALGSVQYSTPAGPFLPDATPQVDSIQGPQLPSPELLQTWEKIHQAMQRAAGGAEGFQAAVEMERSKILPYDDLAKQLEEVEKHYRGGFLAADNAQRIVDNLAKQATARTREHTDALEKQAREMERQHAQPQPQLRVDQYAEPLGPVTLADATPQVESIQGPQLPSPELLQTWEKIHQAMQRAAGGAEGFQAAVEMERSKILPYDDLAKQLEEVEKHYRGGFLAADNAQRIVDSLAKQATARTREHTDALEKQAREMERQHAQAGKLALVYGLASGALMAWVRAGLSGTAEGERLGLMFGLISREVASIFTPAIHAALRGLENLYAAFRELTGGQQETIRNTAAMALGFLGIATLVPRLVSAVASLGATLQAAMAAQPVLFLVSALGGVLLASEQGRAALGELARSMEPILAAAAAIARAFEPVAEAVAAILTPITQVLGAILRFLGPVLEFVGPVVALTVLFNALGNAIVAAFTRGAAAIATATAALAANTAAATANAAANTAAGAASGAAGAASAASGLGGILGKIGGVIGNIFKGPVGWAALGLGLVSAVKGLFSSKKEEPAQRVSPKAGPIEGLEATYTRIQNQISSQDIAQNTRERTLRVLEDIRDRFGMRGLDRPAVAA